VKNHAPSLAVAVGDARPQYRLIYGPTPWGMAEAETDDTPDQFDVLRYSEIPTERFRREPDSKSSSPTSGRPTNGDSSPRMLLPGSPLSTSTSLARLT